MLYYQVLGVAACAAQSSWLRVTTTEKQYFSILVPHWPVDWMDIYMFATNRLSDIGLRSRGGVGEDLRDRSVLALSFCH